jgi:predicted nucleic-acid-binding protein
MKITADTNVLVRAITGDHKKQSDIAKAELASADAIVLTLPTLCELVWVLSQGYGIAATDIAETLRRLINARNVLTHRPAVEAGLALLEAGGDFADGVIAHEGRILGADLFVSFDKKAVKLLQRQGEPVRQLP